MAAASVPPSPATTTGDSNWAGLPSQLIISIAEQLPISDCFRLRAVCTSWASAVADYLPSSPHFPWLMLPPENHGHLSFLTLSNNRSYPSSTLPEILGIEFVVGFQNGWLVTLNRSFQARLLNPLSGSQIQLPSCIPPVTIRKVVLSTGGGGGCRGFVAVAMYGILYYCLAFARPGDAAWTPLNAEGVEDAVFHDGKLFTVFTRGMVQAFDLTGPSPDSSSVLYDSWYDGLIASFPRSNLHDGYLVSSSGDLLQVWRERDVGTNITKRFIVTKLENSCWVEIEGLGDQTLFLGSKHSLSISSRDIPGLKGNCIYFTAERRDSHKRIVSDVGVFDIEKGTIEPCFSPKFQFNCLRSMPPIWFSIVK